MEFMQCLQILQSSHLACFWHGYYHITHVIYLNHFTISRPSNQEREVSVDFSPSKVTHEAISKQVILSHYSWQQGYNPATSHLETQGDSCALKTIYVSQQYSLKKKVYDTQIQCEKKSFLCLPIKGEVSQFCLKVRVDDWERKVEGQVQTAFPPLKPLP